MFLDYNIQTMSNRFDNVPLPKIREVDAETKQYITEISDSLLVEVDDLNSYCVGAIVKIFLNPDFWNSLPSTTKQNSETLKSYIKNSALLKSIIETERRKRGDSNVSEEKLFGEEIEISGIKHYDGGERVEDYGNVIHLGHLTSVGIDPSQVLIFRATQASNTPKPERYWTTDYFETINGLMAEIPDEQRENLIVLVSNLLTVSSSNEGLIQDHNDDNGLAVCQIGSGNFDQNLALSRFSAKSSFDRTGMKNQ